MQPGAMAVQACAVVQPAPACHLRPPGHRRAAHAQGQCSAACGSTWEGPVRRLCVWLVWRLASLREGHADEGQHQARHLQVAHVPAQRPGSQQRVRVVASGLTAGLHCKGACAACCCCSWLCTHGGSQQQRLMQQHSAHCQLRCLHGCARRTSCSDRWASALLSMPTAGAGTGQ